MKNKTLFCFINILIVPCLYYIKDYNVRMRTNICEQGKVLKNKKDKRSIGYTIRHTSNSIKNYIDQILNERMKDSLTGIEGMTMAFIFRHKREVITARDIMSHSRVNKSTTSETLSGLVKKGYIEMKPYKKDRRVKIIVLTKLGEKINAQFDEIFVEINARIENGLTEEDKANIFHYLEVINENVK